VVIYVKPLNSSALFNEDARELLATVTDTNVDDWKEEHVLLEENTFPFFSKGF